MRMRWLAGSGTILGAVSAVLMACGATPSEPAPHAQGPLDPAAHLDPAANPPVGAPPPTNELQQAGGASDVTVPDMFKSDDASPAEKHMGFGGATGGPPVTVFLERNGGTFPAGADDATNHVSSVLSYYGRAQTTLPAAG